MSTAIASAIASAIEVSSLTKVFSTNKRSVRAVDNLNLSVPTGKVFSFLGPNGAGKTTTIKMICGLITPTAGRIALNGFDVNRQPRQALSQIGVVLEGARNIYWRLSAWENLLYFGRLRGYVGSHLKVRAEALLRELDLWERRHEEVRFFSRGMQQKIAIASALMTDPPILLLDEPTMGLDIESAKIVERWLTTLTREGGKTVLLTTHQLELAQRVSDHVAVIQAGALIASRPIDELIALFGTPTYKITVQRHLDKNTFPWLDGFALTARDDDTTVISGIADQGTVYDVLHILGALNLPLLSVSLDTPTLEEIFLRLVNKERQA